MAVEADASEAGLLAVRARKGESPVRRLSKACLPGIFYGFPKNRVPYFGVLIVRFLLF